MEKKKKSKENDKGSSPPYNVLKELYSILMKEKNSTAGRFNIFVDALLALIIIVYLLSSTVAAVARIIASIFNSELTGQSGDNIVLLLVIFLITSLLCFVFMWFTKREHAAIDEQLQDK